MEMCRESRYEFKVEFRKRHKKAVVVVIYELSITCTYFISYLCLSGVHALTCILLLVFVCVCVHLHEIHFLELIQTGENKLQKTFYIPSCVAVRQCRDQGWGIRGFRSRG